MAQTLTNTNNNPLFARTLRNLDWTALTGALEERSRSPLGKSLAKKLAPLPSLEASEQRFKLLEEAAIISASPELRKSLGLPAILSELEDPSASFHRASRSGVLDPREIFISGHFMEVLSTVGEGLRKAPAEHAVTALQNLFRFAPKALELAALIKRSVNALGEILDTASAELSKLRRSRLEKRLSLEKSLRGRVIKWHQDGLLHDDFFDQIDGRFVVPLRADHRGEIAGHILSQSQSRQSLFIEPIEFVAGNNELQEVEAKVRFEELRILRELSQKIGAKSTEFLGWIEPLAELDFIFAAADLNQDWSLTKPKFGGRLHVVALSHPLLRATGKSVVANNIYLESNFACVISGPNTGGKTVLLKALALASLMAKCGLFISAAAGSQLPFYANTLALVGDDQNLTDGLSSFSSQIRDMKSLFAELESPSLILIDEILSSTDPEEATALSTAILKKLIACGHHIFMTTHFSGLAQNAAQTAGTLMAAMEFEDHRPTYRFLPNQMGKSHALEVATMLGLEPEIIQEAKQWMNPEKIQYESLASRLQEELRTYEARNKNLEAQNQMEMQELKSQLELQFQERLNDFILRSEEQMKDLERKLSAQSVQQPRGFNLGRPGVKTAAAQKVSADLKALAKSAISGAANPDQNIPEEKITADKADDSSLEPAVGLEVHVKAHVPLWAGRYGVIQQWNETSQKAVVAMGALRTELHKNDFNLEGKPRSTQTKTKLRNVKKSYSQAHSEGLSSLSAAPSSTLNLRGLRGIEVKEALEKFLDSALSTGASRVKVVTGHGSGAVKAAFLEVIKSLNYVSGFKPERTGDDGAWIVEL